MKLAYVAGPYSGKNHNEVYEHIQAARDVAVRLWQLGYAVICPHLNSKFMTGAVDESVFIAGGLEMLRRCNLVVMVDGWPASAGSIVEVKEAGRLGIKTFGHIDNVPPASEFHADGQDFFGHVLERTFEPPALGEPVKVVTMKVGMEFQGVGGLSGRKYAVEGRWDNNAVSTCQDVTDDVVHLTGIRFSSHPNAAKYYGLGIPTGWHNSGKIAVKVGGK